LTPLMLVFVAGINTDANRSSENICFYRFHFVTFKV
jgi:hypothetical protein